MRLGCADQLQRRHCQLHLLHCQWGECPWLLSPTAHLIKEEGKKKNFVPWQDYRMIWRLLNKLRKFSPRSRSSLGLSPRSAARLRRRRGIQEIFLGRFDFHVLQRGSSLMRTWQLGHVVHKEAIFWRCCSFAWPNPWHSERFALRDGLRLDHYFLGPVSLPAPLVVVRFKSQLTIRFLVWFLALSVRFGPRLTFEYELNHFLNLTGHGHSRSCCHGFSVASWSEYCTIPTEEGPFHLLAKTSMQVRRERRR